MEPSHPRPEWVVSYQAGGIIERDRQHGTTGPMVVVKNVCGSCNHGWMSQLEGRIKPIMAPMIRGARVTLNTEQQVDLATWASKTVAALEYHEPTSVVTRPKDRELIRTELRPPHHHRVRLAYRSECSESLVLKTFVARSAGAEDEGPDSFATLIAIGFLLIQVWGGHGADTGVGLTRAGTKIGRAIMLWPPVMGAVEWPPVQPIPESDLDAFAREVIPFTEDSPEYAAWKQRRDPEASDDER